MSVEQWKDVPGCPGYKVSDRGRVSSHRRPDPRLLKPRINRKGYEAVTLYRDGSSPRQVFVHVLVLEAFVGPRPDGQQTRHLDGVPGHNTLRNLAWGTGSQNSLDTIAHGNHGQARREDCRKGHPFDSANTIHRSDGRRVCRTCRNARRRAARARGLSG